MRRPALGAGVVLIVVAFAAATRVADTREGLIYEVVTLLAGLAGVGLLLYGLVATFSHSRPTTPAPPVVTPAAEKVHNAGELLVGASGLVLAAILLGGIAITAGGFWVLLGLILLLPMIAGCIYLCFTFARGPRRDWKIDLQKLISQR
ncbi:MAG TPA: hypothetical protein DCF65_09960 [Chloroflexi bacterium]|jgi:hypothetical protein|nr:hypothetical protein [Chloroflexota bacterium]HAF20141.1 hypothetical protein [Chloroflexota bacterium]